MADTPPVVPEKTKFAGKNAPKALKTFIFSATRKEENVTFLKGKRVVGFPTALIEAYQNKGLIELTQKEED